MHSAVALYEGLAGGHTVVGSGEVNASQHSIQLVTCGGQICLRSGRGWGGEGRGVGGQLVNRVVNRMLMRQVNENEVVTSLVMQNIHTCTVHTHPPHDLLQALPIRHLLTYPNTILTPSDMPTSSP